MLNTRQAAVLPFLSVFQLFIDSSTAAGIAADFSLYPQAAQGCLSSAATSSKCDDTNVPAFNACVCSNGGGFLDSSAKCLNSNDKNDLVSVWATMSRNCADSKTPIAYDQAKWLSVAGSGTATTPAPNPTTPQPTTKISTIVQTIVAPTGTSTDALVSTVTLQPSAGQTAPVVSVLTLLPGQTTVVSSVGASPATATPSATSSSSSKFPIGAIVGIAVGVPVLLALLGIILFLWLRGRKKDDQLREVQAHAPADSSPYVAEKRPASMAPSMMTDTTKYNPSAQFGQPSPPQPAPQQVYNMPPPQAGYQQYQSSYPQTQPQAPYAQHSMGGMPGAVPYGGNPQYHQHVPPPGVMELSGPEIPRPQELPGHGS